MKRRHLTAEFKARVALEAIKRKGAGKNGTALRVFFVKKRHEKLGMMRLVEREKTSPVSAGPLDFLLPQLLTRDS